MEWNEPFFGIETFDFFEWFFGCGKNSNEFIQILKQVFSIPTFNFLFWIISQELLHNFADKLDLWQVEFFALCEEGNEKVERWLQLDKTVADENLQPDSKLVLKVRIWKEPKKLVDPVAAHLFYLEVRDQFVTVNHLCPETTAFCLAALQMQLVYGDFIPEKHKIGFFE